MEICLAKYPVCRVFCSPHTFQRSAAAAWGPWPCPRSQRRRIPPQPSPAAPSVSAFPPGLFKAVWVFSVMVLGMLPASAPCPVSKPPPLLGRSLRGLSASATQICVFPELPDRRTQLSGLTRRRFVILRVWSSDAGNGAFFLEARVRRRTFSSFERPPAFLGSWPLSLTLIFCLPLIRTLWFHCTCPILQDTPPSSGSSIHS